MSTKPHLTISILNNGRDEIDLMDVFDDKQSDVHPVSSVWGSDVPQNLEVDHLAQDFGNIRDLSTVSGSERLGTLSSFYSGREEIWGVSSDDFTLTCQQSPVRSAENTSQPIEERQGFDMSNRLLQLNLFPAELNDPDFSTLFNQHVSLFDNGDPLIVHDNTRPLDGFSAQVTNTENQTSKSSAKRKSPSSSGGQRRKKQFLDGGFKASLLQDAELSQAQGKPLPQETYFKPSIEDKLLNLGKESFCGFCTFLVQVGGTQSLIAFREALEYTRKMGDQPHNRQWIARELPNSERFKIIREIQANATYLQILQWNHILCLFRCSGRLELCSNAGIIPVSGDGLSSQPRTRGNPRNIEVAKIINKMMEENFPELGPGSKDYKGRRREVSELRKLGQRLHMLAQRFGDGVIGLLPFNRCGDEAVPVMTKTMCAFFP